MAMVPQEVPVAREMRAPRMKTRVDIARGSMAAETADAMKSSVPSTCSLAASAKPKLACSCNAQQ